MESDLGSGGRSGSNATIGDFLVNREEFAGEFSKITAVKTSGPVCGDHGASLGLFGEALEAEIRLHKKNPIVSFEEGLVKVGEIM
jgi:hypothetical protein